MKKIILTILISGLLLGDAFALRLWNIPEVAISNPPTGQTITTLNIVMQNPGVLTGVFTAGFLQGTPGQPTSGIVQLLVDGVVVQDLVFDLPTTNIRVNSLAQVFETGSLTAGAHTILLRFNRFAGRTINQVRGAAQIFGLNEPDAVADDLQNQLDALSFVQTVTDNGDGTVTFTYRDATTLTINTGSLVDLVDNGDGTITFTDSSGATTDIDLGRVDDLTQVGSTITITYSDGTTSTLNAGGLDSVIPVTGGLQFTYLDGTIQTIPYPNFIETVVQEGDVLVFTYSDGTTYTTESIIGPAGLTGANGANGGRGAKGSTGKSGKDGKIGKDGDDGKTMIAVAAGIGAAILGSKLFSGGLLGGAAKNKAVSSAATVVSTDAPTTTTMPVYYNVKAPISTTAVGVGGTSSRNFGAAYLPTDYVPAEHFPEAVYLPVEPASKDQTPPQP